MTGQEGVGREVSVTALNILDIHGVKEHWRWGRVEGCTLHTVHRSPSSQVPSGLRVFGPLSISASLLPLSGPPQRFGLDIVPLCTHDVLGPGPGTRADMLIFGPHDVPVKELLPPLLTDD